MPGSEATLRALLQDVRGYLSDQGSLHLQGLDVSPQLLRTRAHGPEAASSPVGPEPEPGPTRTLVQVRDHLGACQRCPLCAHRTSIVFGVGDPAADLMLVGEAPGRDEDLLGEPFVGEAGMLLDRMLHAMGLHRGQVYIANVIKCRPPKNRYPSPLEVATCSPFVMQQLRAVSPKVVLALGRLAAHTLLGTQQAISRLRGTWAAIDGVPLMPTFHPAYLLRTPRDKALVWQDLQQVMAKLGLPGGGRA